MKIDPDWIEDLLKFGGAAMGHLFDAKAGAKSALRSHGEVLARRLDLVTRDEFEAAFAMLQKSRMMQEEIAERLSVIEKKLGISSRKTQSETILKNQKRPAKTTRGNLLSVKHSNRKRKPK